MIKEHFLQINCPKNTKLFGLLPGNKEITNHTLRNQNGCELSVINYGATITSLKIPTYKGKKIDVVLGFDSLENYVASFDLPSPPYFGSVVGRFAGRIYNGSFKLNGKNIALSKNWKNHQIHGGHDGFSKKIWSVIATTNDKNPSITLEYISKHNEENFPGELNIKVTYTLTEANELRVSFEAKSSQDTIINLTQHSYFNLNGHNADIKNQKIIVHSKNILETSDELIPTGNYINLKNHPFDFSKVQDCPTSIDNTFVLEKKLAATLYGEISKIKMTVSTNQPAVHIYVGGNCFDSITGKENAHYNTISGICFETQNFPDAPNHSHFPNAILKKGETYKKETSFLFESY